jgi:hypothetical protein
MDGSHVQGCLVPVFAGLTLWHRNYKAVRQVLYQKYVIANDSVEGKAVRVVEEARGDIKRSAH